MIVRIKNFLFDLYNRITGSIAFYPSLISILFFLLAIIFIQLESREFTEFLLQKASFLVINDAETGRVILGTLIGGIISLTVFSFSMVMVLLNQASNSFSPRLLPGLITDKTNQIVLGFYIGSILFNIIALISILPTSDSYHLNGFTILFGIVLGIICLGLFVFFIHTISQNIQINVILNKIHHKSKTRLLELTEQRQGNHDRLKIDGWFDIKGDRNGYFQGVNIGGLKSLVKEYKSSIKIVIWKGQYLLPGMTILKSEKELDKEQIESLMQTLLFEGFHDPTENFVLGIKQLTEVGVKAMSPGINDPGTAIITIEYLTELLALRMQLEDSEIYEIEDSEQRIELATIDFKSLIYHCLASYRLYCKHDINLMEKIIEMIEYLQHQSCPHTHYKKILSQQLQIVKADIESNISNDFDRNSLVQLIDKYEKE